MRSVIPDYKGEFGESGCTVKVTRELNVVLPSNLRRHNLPAPLSTFIGRESEVVEVKQRLSEQRLVTLTGPGGCGKTRLAVRVASDLLDEFPDGVWLIELASLADAALVPQAVASTLAVQEQVGRTLIDALIDHLLLQHTLLLLDNCEHLVVVSARMAETLLQSCPSLKILATSRETLGIPGEAVWSVPPLSLPDVHLWRDPSSRRSTLSIYKGSEAIQLFVVRAAAAVPTFVLTEQNGAWVADICRRLDGMPLAIELAAARVRTLSVQKIAERLDDRFHLLTSGSRTAPTRQQTLEATLGWSFALLSESEQKLLSRLSVFTGGWTLEAAEAVCSGNGIEARDILDLLTQLGNKSLIVIERVPAQETRYWLLETIRQYTSNLLQTAGVAMEVQARHRDWFMSLAGQAEPELKGPKHSEWLERLDREHDNFRAALAWSLENDPSVALQLAERLEHFWFLRGRLFGEGIEWLGRVLSRVDVPEEAATRARAFLWLGTLTLYRGDYATARSAYERSLALYQELKDQDNIAEALYRLADATAIEGDAIAARSIFSEAHTLLEDSLTRLHNLGDMWNFAHKLNLLGEISRIEGDYAAARLYYEESLNIRQELGDPHGMAICLLNLGYVAHHMGDYLKAANFFQESLALFQNYRGSRGVVDCLMGFAGVAGSAGYLERAAKLFGAVDSLREAIHFGPAATYPDLIEFDRYIANVRAQLDEVRFSVAWTEGRAMTLEQAVTYGQLALEMPSTFPNAKDRFGGLTRREREVAALIAQGMSNREIAVAMTVAGKTVETYVTRILNKLGYNTRVQIAIWAVERGLVVPARSLGK